MKASMKVPGAFNFDSCPAEAGSCGDCDCEETWDYVDGECMFGQAFSDKAKYSYKLVKGKVEGCASKTGDVALSRWCDRWPTEGKYSSKQYKADDDEADHNDAYGLVQKRGRFRQTLLTPTTSKNDSQVKVRPMYDTKRIRSSANPFAESVVLLFWLAISAYQIQ